MNFALWNGIGLCKLDHDPLISSPAHVASPGFLSRGGERHATQDIRFRAEMSGSPAQLLLSGHEVHGEFSSDDRLLPDLRPWNWRREIRCDWI